MLVWEFSESRGRPPRLWLLLESVLQPGLSLAVEMD